MKALAETLLSYGGTAYLLCDGATMSDVRNSFAPIGLSAVPLFRGSLAPEIINSGPWLVVARDHARLSLALDLAHKYKVGVCWIADVSDPEEMTRHLRSLNLGRLPDGSICYFRHYDPNALAWLVERLDGEQAAQLFGPAHILGFASGVAAGSTIEKPSSLPSPRPGPIAFTDNQMSALKEKNEATSRSAIKDFLRFSFPAELSGKSDDELLNFIEAREQIGRTYGLHTERHIAMWAYGSVGVSGNHQYEQALAAKIKTYD